MARSTLKPGKPLKQGKPLARKTPMSRGSGFKSPVAGAGLLRSLAVRAKLASTSKAPKAAKLRKTRSDHLKDAQIAFNAFIRARDSNKPCISCGCRDAMAFDAGHYRSVGAQPALRFNEDNVHKQCVDCNQTLAGNAAAYRVGLIGRIGLARVEILECEHPPAKFTAEDAKRIKVEYTAKRKALGELA
jgi:hypothetical protein